MWLLGICIQSTLQVSVNRLSAFLPSQIRLQNASSHLPCEIGVINPFFTAANRDAGEVGGSPSPWDTTVQVAELEIVLWSRSRSKVQGSVFPQMFPHQDFVSLHPTDELKLQYLQSPPATHLTDFSSYANDDKISSLRHPAFTQCFPPSLTVHRVRTGIAVFL